jgi:formate dehydrogenase subunit gamma
VTRTASEQATIRRFGRTERLLHWTHASSFLLLLATGLALYLPALAELVGRRPLLKELHLWTAAAWVVALVLVIGLGDRRRLAADWREIERIDADDRRWLRAGRAAPGRFNAGQKLNALLTTAFALLFAVSGFFIWLGERDHRFLLDGAGPVHVVLTWLSIVLLTGHLYLAVIHPRTRHSLRGITRGDVRLDWAAEHHGRWVQAELSTRAEPDKDGARRA